MRAILYDNSVLVIRRHDEASDAAYSSHSQSKRLNISRWTSIETAHRSGDLYTTR